MLKRIFLFIVAGVGGYVLTVVAAFVFWHWTGASGPNPNPLLAVLFIIAPAVALCCGLYAALHRTRRPDREARDRSTAYPAPQWGRGSETRNRRSFGPVEITIIILCALLIGAILGSGALGGRLPFVR